MSIENVILNILSLPTAPFCESWVRAKCIAFCSQKNIPYYQDNAGNLWVNAQSEAAVASAKVVFVAHMDHPGIAIRDFYGAPDGIYAQGVWLGGGPKNVRDLPVTIFSNAESALKIDGQIVYHSVEKEHPKNVKIKVSDPDKKWARLVAEADSFAPWGACLKFQQLPASVEMQGEQLVARANDDLISVAILLEAFSVGATPGAVILLTRDEEKGMAGTHAALATRQVSKDAKVISVEVTDFTFAQVTMGDGPVVRYGDAETQYSAELSAKIQEIADQYRKMNAQFHVQVQGTSIGTTEAGSFAQSGYQCSGLSIPLQNYHNKTPDFRVAPEIVHMSDVRGLTEFLPFLIKYLTQDG